ncbi:MAG: hypothetical protein WA984_10915 [Phormidesmis sp.]
MRAFWAAADGNRVGLSGKSDRTSASSAIAPQPTQSSNATSTQAQPISPGSPAISPITIDDKKQALEN